MQEQENHAEVAAYDADGRPLYYHPSDSKSVKNDPPQPAIKRQSHITSKPTSAEGHNFHPQIRAQYANEPKTFHATRPVEPQYLEISDNVRSKNKLSREKYPYLNLSEGEFVILDIKRHPIGMLIPVGATLALLFAIFAFAGLYPSMFVASAGVIMPPTMVIFVVAIALSALVVLGGAVALWVYLQNQFFMTNEGVIQEIQESLFSRHEQTVSLGSIEDASFRQAGIIQTVFNYGTIRLSTEGEETTYVFTFVTNPRKQVSIINNAIEAFKNGRPVEDD